MNTIGGKGQPWWNPMSSENESNVMQAHVQAQVLTTAAQSDTPYSKKECLGH